MVSGKAEVIPPQKGGSVLQIKEDDKFFSRLLSKESSMSHPSFRVASVSTVPFVWESQPGTPKHPSFSNSNSSTLIPPLTPPPSYYFNANENLKPVKKRGVSSNYKLLLAIFPKLSLKNKAIMSPPSSSSSSSGSFRVVPMGRRRFLSNGSSFDFRGDEEDEGDATSPTSTLCFKGRRAGSCKK